MWTKKNLSKEQNELNMKHDWYWKEFDKFSTLTKEIITNYTKDCNINDLAQTPPYLSFSLTYSCNLACDMCFQYDRKKI